MNGAAVGPLIAAATGGSVVDLRFPRSLFRGRIEIGPLKGRGMLPSVALVPHIRTEQNRAGQKPPHTSLIRRRSKVYRFRCLLHVDDHAPVSFAKPGGTESAIDAESLGTKLMSTAVSRVTTSVRCKSRFVGSNFSQQRVLA